MKALWRKRKEVPEPQKATKLLLGLPMRQTIIISKTRDRLITITKMTTTSQGSPMLTSLSMRIKTSATLIPKSITINKMSKVLKTMMNFRINRDMCPFVSTPPGERQISRSSTRGCINSHHRAGFRESDQLGKQPIVQRNSTMSSHRKVKIAIVNIDEYNVVVYYCLF